MIWFLSCRKQRMVLKPVAFGDSALTVLTTNLKQAKQNLQLFSIKKASHPSHPQFPAHYKLFFYLTNKINLPCFLPSLSVSMERAEGEKHTRQLLVCLLLQGWQDVNCCGNHGQSSHQRGKVPSIKAKSIRKTIYQSAGIALLTSRRKLWAQSCETEKKNLVYWRFLRAQWLENKPWIISSGCGRGWGSSWWGVLIHAGIIRECSAIGAEQL